MAENTKIHGNKKTESNIGRENMPAMSIYTADGALSEKREAQNKITDGNKKSIPQNSVSKVEKIP